MGIQIFINDEEIEKRIVFLKDGVLDDFFVWREKDQSLVGNIYKGIVENVVPGIQAAFINIGQEKNGFLHFSDILDAQAAYEGVLDEDIDVESREQRPEQKKKNIKDILKVGNEIIVQVIKNPIGSKGVRLTTNVSIPGRYSVLLPFDARFGISRRIESREERKRLKELLASVRIPAGLGAIIRTAGEGKDKKIFAKDIRYLVNVWKKIDRLSKKSGSPVCIYEDLDIVLKMLRDDYTEEVEKVIVDSKYEFKRIKRFLNTILRRRKSQVEYYNEREPFFQKYEIEDAIKKVFNRKVWLKSGCYLVFDQTEALIAVDVNSGRHVGKNDQEKTNLDINMQAAEEIARQLRLRNVGGIVVIDFIDMKSRKNREAVLRCLKEGLKQDKAKTNVLPISRIGLVEMTRQRVQDSTKRAFYDDCPCCHGLGIVKSITSMGLEIYREIKGHLSKRKRLVSIELVMHPTIADVLLKDEKSVLRRLPRKVYEMIEVSQDINSPLDEYSLKIK